MPKYDIAIIKNGHTIVHKFPIYPDDKLSDLIFRGFVQEMIDDYVVNQKDEK